jgi:hypothetical protein
MPVCHARNLVLDRTGIGIDKNLKQTNDPAQFTLCCSRSSAQLPARARLRLRG